MIRAMMSLVFSACLTAEALAGGLGAQFRSNSGFPVANVSLPAHVAAPDGKITLFADFGHAENGAVPLYLVNRTDKQLVLDAYDHDLYLKLERQRSDGTWQRAQGAVSGLCGDGSRYCFLMPGQHFVTVGYSPMTGVKGRVRYRDYHGGYGDEIVSNEGDGRFSFEDVEEAKYDWLARRDLPIFFQMYIDRGDFVHATIEDSQQGLVALRLMHAYGGLPLAERRCAACLQQLRELPHRTALQEEAFTVLQKLAETPWAEKTNAGKLFKVCMDAVDHVPGNVLDLGSSTADASYVWIVLGLMQMLDPQIQTPSWRQKWTPVIKRAIACVPNASVREQNPLCGILRQRLLADEALPDNVWEPLLSHGNENVRRVAADTLGRRARWSRLIELGAQLNSDMQVSILGGLAQNPLSDQEGGHNSRGGGIREPWNDKEIEFWRQCLNARPLKSASLLRRLHKNGDRGLPSWVYEPIRRYWVKQVELSQVKDADFELADNTALLQESLEFLAIENSKQDKSLLESLVQFRGYDRGSDFGSESPKEDSFIPSPPRIFSVRETAKRLLEHPETVDAGGYSR